tara:strand:+ start:1080 stop:4451 length:3372 start_codon:yes stop_codon:yes gene_type:complete
MSAIEFKLEEINMLDFLIEESKADYVKSKIQQISELYKLFIINTINEDRIWLNTFQRNYQKTIDPENQVTDTELKDLSKYIDNYNAKFLIFLLKTQCNYSKIEKSLINDLESKASSGYPVDILTDKFKRWEREEEFKKVKERERKRKRKEQVGLEAFRKMKILGMSLTPETVVQWHQATPEEEQRILKTLDLLINKDDNLKRNSNLLGDALMRDKVVSVASGGGKEGYQASKRVLERVAEPKHDFGGDRAPFLNKTIKSKYSGDYDADYTPEQFNSDIRMIDNIFASSGGIKKIASKGWVKSSDLLREVKKAILQCKDTIKATIHSSSLFEATTFSRMFLNPEFENINDDMSNLNKYNAFKFFSCKAEIQNFATLTSDGSANIKLTKDAVFKNLKTFITESSIKYHVFDTSADMPGVNHLLKEMGLEKITPLVNIWDPASASVGDFNNHINTGDGFKLGGFVTDRENFKKDIKDTTPIQLASRDTPSDYPTFKVEHNDSEGKETHPIKLTVNFPNNSSSEIKLNSGFSVSMLDEIARNVNDIKETDHNTDIIKPEICFSGAEGIGNFIDSLKKYAVGDSGKKNQVVRLLLDMKKSGDWGQVKWVNTVPTGYESLFVSGDKLCALYSILHNNSTIFGNPGVVRKYLINDDGNGGELSATIGLFIQPKELSDADLLDNYKSLKNQIEELLNSENSIFRINIPLDAGASEIPSAVINLFLQKIGLITLNNDESKRNHMKSAIKLAKLLLDILNNINKLSNNKIKDICDELISFNTNIIKAMAKKIVPSYDSDSIIAKIQIFNDDDVSNYSSGSSRAKSKAEAIFNNIADTLNITAEAEAEDAKEQMKTKAKEYAENLVNKDVKSSNTSSVEPFECPEIEVKNIANISNFSENINNHLGIQHIFQVLPNLFSTIFNQLLDLTMIENKKGTKSHLNYYAGHNDITERSNISSIESDLKTIATTLTIITLGKFGQTLDTGNNSWEFGNTSDGTKYNLRDTQWNNLSVRDVSLELTKAKLLIDCVLKNNKRLDDIDTDELDKLYENFDGIQRKMMTELMPLAKKTETGILAAAGAATASAVKSAVTGLASGFSSALGMSNDPANPPPPPGDTSIFDSGGNLDDSPGWLNS